MSSQPPIISHPPLLYKSMHTRPSIFLKQESGLSSPKNLSSPRKDRIEPSPRITLVNPRFDFDGENLSLKPGFITPSLTGMDESCDERRPSNLQFGGWISRKSLRKPRRSILEIIDPDKFISLLEEENPGLKPQSRTTSSANLNCDKGPVMRNQQLMDSMISKQDTQSQAMGEKRPMRFTAPVSPHPLQRLVRHKRKKARLVIGQLSPNKEEKVSVLTRQKSPDSITTLNTSSRRSISRSIKLDLQDDSTTTSSIASLNHCELKPETEIKCHKVKWSAFKKLHKKLEIESPQRTSMKSHSPQASRLYPSNLLPSALLSPVQSNTRGIKVFKRKLAHKEGHNVTFSFSRKAAMQESLSPEPVDLTKSLVVQRLTRHEQPVGMNAMNSANLKGRLFAERWATKRNDYSMIEFLKHLQTKRPLKKI